MNVGHGAGSILTFKDAWTSRDEPPSGEPKPADAAWLDHCRARELAERAAAKNAGSIEARRVHQELAQAYASVIEGAEG